MMKNGSKRFASLKRLAEWKENRAAALFGRERSDRDGALKRLRELRHYRQEYLQRYTQSIQTGGSVARMRDYQLFIDKLETAISEQESLVRQHEKQCEQAKRAWGDEYTNTRTLDTVIERKRAQEQRAQAKSEQRVADDRSPRRD